MDIKSFLGIKTSLPQEASNINNKKRNRFPLQTREKTFVPPEVKYGNFVSPFTIKLSYLDLCNKIIADGLVQIHFLDNLGKCVGYRNHFNFGVWYDERNGISNHHLVNSRFANSVVGRP